MKDRKKTINPRLHTEYQIPNPSKSKERNVRFSDGLVHQNSEQRKHRSSSILKNKKSSTSFNRMRPKSDSTNSLGGQGTKDDQSCENSSLNKIMRDQYASMMQKYSKKRKYCDEIFPPVISSLCSSLGKRKYKQLNVQWRRIPEVFHDRDLVMWGTDPSSNHIEAPSNLAPDYFVFALNCLKGNKQILRKIFQTQNTNSHGLYMVKIFQANVWKNILIDDYIPVIEEEGKYRPAFVRGNMGADEPIQIWVYLIEKAYAKYYSSYESLQTGNIFDFLESILNGKLEVVELEQKTMEKVKNYCKRTDAIMFGQESIENYFPIFSNPDSTFSIHKQNKKIKLTPSELTSSFMRLYAIKFNSYAYVGFCPIRQIKQSISVRYFHLTTSSKCLLTLSQKDEKFFQPSAKYHYKWIRMILLLKEQNNNGYRWIDGAYDNQKNIHIQTDLQSGQYFIFVLPEWGQRTYDLNLILRAKTLVRLQRKVYENGMIEEGCADLSQRFGKLNQLSKNLCSYNCVFEQMGMIIENINNEKVRGEVKVIRSIDGLSGSLPIEPINKEFENKKLIEVMIKGNSYFTVVLMMKGGIDKKFFKNFNFVGK